jgi:hypothetical protein
MNIHAIYLPDSKVFKVYKSKDSVEYVRFKCKENGCIYVGTRPNGRFNLNLLSCYKTHKDDFYYANDSSCADVGRIVSVEYEDMWNLIHNIYKVR